MIDLTGKQFGRLTVIKRDTSELARRTGRPMWICQCSCGAVVSIYGTALREGYTRSCGCYRRDSMRERRRLEKLNHATK